MWVCTVDVGTEDGVDDVLVAALVLFFLASIYTCLSPRKPPSVVMSYAPTVPEIPIQQAPVQPYSFAVPGEGWQSSHTPVNEREWTNIDLSHDPYYSRSSGR